MNKILILCFVALFSTLANAQTPAEDSAYLVKNYIKLEKMIPMRDGIKLFTAVYLPKDSSKKHPMLMVRTPYSCAPYGDTAFKKFWEGYQKKYIRENYIMVFQDVRGRFMSEGEFVDVRPFNPNKTGPEHDEASDTYDTIDWLVKNLSGNNGKVGVFGISYPGFYSTMAAKSGHPALKAVSPQAPVTDWFMGDDFHHNGALMLQDAFGFYSSFGVPRPLPTQKYNAGYSIKEADKYKFFLAAGPLKNFNSQFLGDSIAFWNDLMTHPVYDNWWKSRDASTNVGNIQPAILVVGGLFDAEDCYGAWKTYQAIEKNNPAKHFNKIVMGPWFHGAWGGRSAGDTLGSVQFGSKTSEWYQENVEFPFFQQYLNGKANEKPLPEASIFFTGENKWHQLEKWPPANAKDKALYLQAGGGLSFEHPKTLGYRNKPDTATAFTEYISDPANPVPQEGPDTIKSRTREYMVGDQRFAAKRADVAVFQTAVLEKDITLAGPLLADLMVSISSSDADFVVKLIDVFPDNISGTDALYKGKDSMNGYQMMVRGEIMRGKFRNSFEFPEPFVPNKITRVKYELPDVAHTFQKGHRIMVQIQSSWFPVADRNPQTFTDIYKATEADFQKASIKVFHTEGVTSKLVLPVVE
jgi:putative CocE/NonD family hydrolase